MSVLVISTANCGTLGDWGKSQGIWHSYTETPEPGDVVLFDWDGNHRIRHHCGFVLSTPDGGDTVYTIEGNTAVGNDSNGGQVMERTRYRKYIVGYIRPRYESEEQKKEVIAWFKSQVGVKESPANSNKVKYNTAFYGREVSGPDYPWCAVFISCGFNGLVASSGTEAATSYGAELSVTLNTLRFGDKGPQVKTAQRILYARGIKGANGKAVGVDGDFGSNTKEATIKLQKELFPDDASEWDGIWGKKTWTAALTALW